MIRRCDVARGSLLVLALLPVLQCAHPRISLQQLEEIHHDEGGKFLAYRREVPNRGRWSRFWRSASRLFLSSGTPSPTEIDDPIGYCLRRLRELRDEDNDVALDLARGLILTSEMASRDLSRVVRTDSFRTARTLAQRLSLTYDVGETQSDEAISPIVEQVSARVSRPVPPESAASEDPRSLAVQLGRCRAERLSLAHRLARLALVAAQRWTVEGGEDASLAYTEASVDLGAHALYLAALQSLDDGSEAVRVEACRTLLGLAPGPGSAEIAERFERLATSRTKIAIFQTLSGGALARQLDPSFRRVVLDELASQDVAVAYWARHSMALLLGLEPEKSSTEEVRSRWRALGDWDAASERS